MSRLLTPAVPAAGRQPCAGTQGRPVDRGENAAPGNAVWRAGHRQTCLGARPWGTGEETAAEPLEESGTPAPPPPRQADAPTAGQGPPGARGCATAPVEQVYPGGMRRQTMGGWPGDHRPPPRRREPGNHGATPPSLSPRSPLPPAGHGGNGPPPPPGQRGRPPSPRRGRDAQGGDTAEPAHHAPPGPRPPAPAGAATGEQTRAGAQEMCTDHTRGRHANTNRSSMGATPSIPRATPMAPAILPAQGRQSSGPR